MRATERHDFGEGSPHKPEPHPLATQNGVENNRTLSSRQ
jgi:hypothetical protein